MTPLSVPSSWLAYAQSMTDSPGGRFAAVIFGLLCAASLIGFAMGRFKDPQSPGLANYRERVNAWWAMCAILGACFLAGWGATIAFFALCSFMALREFVILTPTQKSDYWALFLAFYVAVPFQYFFIYGSQYGLFSVFIPVWLFSAISAVSALSQDTRDFLARNAKIQFAVLTCVFGVSHAPALMMLQIREHPQGPLLLVFFLFTVQLSDVAQYAFGKLFGKTKLAPKVSPNKTVEGLVLGGLAASLAGACLYKLTPFAFFEAFGLCLLIVLGGFLGGLVMSAVKRSLGAKDWGNAIRGHGGFMDRLDSVAFAAPLFFHAARYFFT